MSSVDSASKQDYPNHRKYKIKLTLGKANLYEEVRCPSCNALLYKVLRKALPDVKHLVQVKCRRCGKVSSG